MMTYYNNYVPLVQLKTINMPRQARKTSGPYNEHQLRDYSKSSNRSENRPLIYIIHEIVGHAAPALVGSETGNAVENENIVRKELNLQEREKEVNHVE